MIKVEKISDLDTVVELSQLLWGKAESSRFGRRSKNYCARTMCVSFLIKYVGDAIVGLAQC